MKKGDRRPILRVRLSLSDTPGVNPLLGSPTPIVTFHMVNTKTRAVKIAAGAAIIEDADEQIVSYSWGPTDTNAGGCYEGTFVVDYGSGVVQSFPSCGGIPIHIEE